MSSTVSWNLQLSLRDDRIDSARDLMEEMVESTRNEAGALGYEWFLTGNSCHIQERYADSGAVVAHLSTFGERFADRFLKQFEPTGLWVYGEPSDEARAILDGFGAVYLSPFGGFTR